MSGGNELFRDHHGLVPMLDLPHDVSDFPCGMALDEVVDILPANSGNIHLDPPNPASVGCCCLLSQLSVSLIHD